MAKGLLFFDTAELAKQMHEAFLRRRARDMIVRPPKIAEQNAVVKFAEKFLKRRLPAASVDHVMSCRLSVFSCQKLKATL